MQISDDLITLIASAGGVSAVVSAFMIYVFKKLFEEKLKYRFSKELELYKAELIVKNELVKETLKLQRELCLNLDGSVYSVRNLAREILTIMPDIQPNLRSLLGDHAFLITEKLYGSRSFLTKELFEKIHSYKYHAHNFIREYDEITSHEEDNIHPDLFKDLNKEYNEINSRCDEIAGEIRRIFEVDRH